MLGFHLLILGAVLAFMGSIMSIKSIIHQPFSEELSSTFLGYNPFQVRNGIIQQVEAVCGTVLTGVSLLFVVAGTLFTTNGISGRNISGLGIDILVYLFAGGGLLTVLLHASMRISRWIYLPKMVKLQSDLYKLSIQHLSNDGRSDQDVATSASIGTALRNKRMEDSERRLEQIGKLIDLPRLPEEDIKLYAERLKPIFERK